MRLSDRAPEMDMVVQRQLETMTTGNAAYLAIFLRVARAAGLNIRLVFAPWRSFGNRPWMTIHPEFLKLTASQRVPDSVKLGHYYWSISRRVWWAFLLRALKEGLRRAGMSIRIHSYLGDPLPEKEADIVSHIVEDARPDIVIAEYSSLAPLLEKTPDIKHRGVLLHDLFSVRAAQFRASGQEPDFRAMSLEGEADQCKSATLALYASRNELKSLSPMIPGADHIWIPPEPPVYEVRKMRFAPHAVFLGTRHAGNLNALHHLLDDIWPRVLEKHPEAALKIAGSICTDVRPQQARQRGVELLGRVKSLSAISGADAIGLAPTLLASGVSIKVAEYLMLGMPTIAYPKAMEGFGDALNDLVEITSTPDQYADRIVALLEDGDRRLALSQKGLIETPKRLSNAALTDFFQELSRHTPPNVSNDLDDAPTLRLNRSRK